MTAGTVYVVIGLALLALAAWWCSRDALASYRERRRLRRPITARMPPQLPNKIAPRDVRYAANVNWLRRHPGQPS